MKWIELTIFTEKQGIDAVCGRLSMLGIDQVEIAQGREEIEDFLRDTAKYWDFADTDALCPEEPCVKAYIAQTEDSAGLIEKIKESFLEFKRNDCENMTGSPRIVTRTVNDEDWANSWKVNYKPYNVGKRLLIRPSWENNYNPKDRVVLSLDPGMAFGSGTHQTTRMCLEAIEKYMKPGDTVLDLGCGSGILGIASLLLGAKNALLIDIDPIAEKIVRENAQLNGMDADRYKILIGDILADDAIRERVCKVKYELITANIIASVIVALAPMIRTWLEKDGTFIASGIIDERLDEVLAAFHANGLDVFEVCKNDDWRQITAKLHQSTKQ